MSVEVTYLTKPGCHLCDEARPTVVAAVDSCGAKLVERSILDDAELEARYRNDIPVVLINGVQHAKWRVDRAKLDAALQLALAEDAPRA